MEEILDLEDTNPEELHMAFQGIHGVLALQVLRERLFHSLGLEEGTAETDLKGVAGQSLVQEAGGRVAGEVVATEGVQTRMGTRQPLY